MLVHILRTKNHVWTTKPGDYIVESASPDKPWLEVIDKSLYLVPLDWEKINVIWQGWVLPGERVHFYIVYLNLHHVSQVLFIMCIQITFRRCCYLWHISLMMYAGISPKLLVTNESTLIIVDTRLGGQKSINLGGLIRAIDFDYQSNKLFWIDSASRNINS